jgi:hypothetical protein
LYYSSKGAKYSSKGKGGSKGSKGDDDDDDATEEPTVAPTKNPEESQIWVMTMMMRRRWLTHQWQNQR